MKQIAGKRIFARNEPADFIGRDRQLERMLRHAGNSNHKNGLVLLATPSAGASELLRQVYDRMFLEQDALIPFYFEIRLSDRTAQNAALRFLSEFLLQTVAFRRHDQKIINASPEIEELVRLAAPADGYWIDRLAETFNGGSKIGVVRNCLSAPLRASANNAPTFVMIDDIHVSAHLEGGSSFIEDLTDIFSRSSVPFVFSGQRRFLFAKTPFETVAVETFPLADAGDFIERLSTRTGVAINDGTRDLIAVQLGGNAGFITSLFAAAAAKGKGLDTYEHVERTYTEEIFGGRIGKHFDAIFDRAVPDTIMQTIILRLLSEHLATTDLTIPLAHWKMHSAIGGAAFDAVLDALNSNEIVSVGAGSVEMDKTNTVLCDYIRGRARLEIAGESRAFAVGDALSDNIKRARALMDRSHRRAHAIGLRELMGAFDGRQISPALVDYAKFRDHFKGAGDQEILEAVRADATTLDLPQIVYSAYTSAFYPRLNEFCDPERSAIGLGFIGNGNEDEVVWIAAEIDSKLEVEREVADTWCDRLEIVALKCNFPHYKIWLIATEGFAPDALEALSERDAYGSSRRQVEMLAALLGAAAEPGTRPSVDEFEIVVPMGDDTEMIAANTIEEIAKRHNFPAKAINQIKHALIEACINAVEHSLSPDRKIHLKFTVDTDRITITVSNRGLRLTDAMARETAPDEARRGWGLKLISGLMDEVKIDETDDGTRITMTKIIKKEKDNEDNDD